MSGDDAQYLLIDRATNDATALTLVNSYVRSPILAPDNTGIYYIGTDPDDKNRGIYFYDFESKSANPIFIEEDGVGFIEHFVLIP